MAKRISFWTANKYWGKALNLSIKAKMSINYGFYLVFLLPSNSNKKTMEILRSHSNDKYVSHATVWSRLWIGIQLAFKKFCFLCDDAHFKSLFAVHAIKAKKKHRKCDTNFQLNIFSTSYNKNKSITISDLFCSCCLNNLIFEWGFFPLFLSLRCHCRHCCCVVGYLIRKVKYAWHWRKNSNHPTTNGKMH